MTETDPPFDDEEEFDPEEAERSIRDFITKADELPGPSVADLSSDVLRIVATAHEQMTGVLGDVLNNKVVATMLELSQRFRVMAEGGVEYSPEQWQLSAASTLVNSFIRPGQPEA